MRKEEDETVVYQYTKVMEELTLSAYDDYDYRIEGENDGEGLFSPFTYLCFALILFLIGLVTLYSASFDRCIRLGLQHYYMLMHQGIGAAVGVFVGIVFCFLPSRILKKMHFLTSTVFAGLVLGCFLLPELALDYQFSSIIGCVGAISIILLLSDSLPIIKKGERKGFYLLGVSIPLILIIVFSGFLSGMGWFLLDMILVVSLLVANGVERRNIIFITLFFAVTFCFVNLYGKTQFFSLISSIFPVSESTFYSRELYVSRMAIRDGGLTGVGMGKGLYKLGLIAMPEDELIYAIFCEESGILGIIPTIISLVIICVVAIRTLNRATKKGEVFMGSMVTGMMVIIVFGSLLNIERTVGFNPFGGVLLPLFSFNPVLEGFYVAMLCMLYKYIHIVGRRKVFEK